MIAELAEHPIGLRETAKSPISPYILEGELSPHPGRRPIIPTFFVTVHGVEMDNEPQALAR